MLHRSALSLAISALAVVICLWQPGRASAWQCGDPWLISPLTSNAGVKATLTQVEARAAAKDYAGAADLLGALLSSTDATVRAELAHPREPEPPLRLIALGARAEYLCLDQNWRVSAALCAEAEDAITAYADAARGKRWAPYHVLLNAALIYYTRCKDSNNVARLFDIAFNSGALRTYLLARYADWAARQGIPTNVIRARIVENARLTQPSDYGSYGELFLLPYFNDSPASIVNAAIAWLEKWPRAPIAEIRTATTLITSHLDPANAEQLRRYHAALFALAMRQPDDDDTRMDVIAFAVNERKKLEVLMPSLTQ